MTVYQPGDVVLVAFPFSSGSSVKARPALVVHRALGSLQSPDRDAVAAVLRQMFDNW